VKFPYAIEQLTFSDNIVENCNSGFSLVAPLFATGLISSQISVCNNRFRNVANNNLQLYGFINTGGYSSIRDVEIIGNDLRDFAQTPLHPAVSGPIPMEPTGITNLVIANNIVDGTATNGISTGNNINMTITGNVIRNQKWFGIELNGGRQISIVGNTVENCTTLATETGYTDRVINNNGGVQLSDVVIANNVYRGSGLSAPDGNGREALRLVTARRVRISGNIFTDWQHEANAVRIGCMMYEVGAGPPPPNLDRTAVQPPPEDCVIEGNTFVITDVNTPVVPILVHAGLRTNVVRNTVRINRNLVAADSNRSVISVVMDPSISDTLVEDNHIHFSGTVTGGPDVAGIGNPAYAAAACAKLTIRRNQVINGPRGYGIRTNSTDLVLFDNDISTCVQTGFVPASPVVPAFRVGSLDVGHASDTTVSRLSAGKIAVENAEVSLTGHKHVAADVTGARSWAAVPASATAAGTAGQEAYDAGFHYVCITTGAAGAAAWKRTPLTAW
jgi:parallel beta-helix repeat protein